MEEKLITLTTDFGHRDPFVGIMKGVIFGINPSARVIDLSHEIPSHDVTAGALVLSQSAPYFPPGTIHVAVVDPGVGTGRKPLLVEAEGSFYIGPDNGVLSLALAGRKAERPIALTRAIYHLKPTSATFHGRDIFAPVAGYLSLGIAAGDFGEPVEGLERLQWPEPERSDGRLRGEVVYADRFGNLITNIHERDLAGFDAEGLTITLGSVTARGLKPNYASAEKGSYIALINSWGLLEIALFQDSAQLRSGARIGARVEVRGAP